MKIIIEVSGGMVVAVHSSDPKIKVNLVDWDNFKEREEDPKTLEETQKLIDEIPDLTMVF